jgi:hypothetical protein
MLGIDDRLAIQDLYARHNAFVDLGDYERWAECFTEDGVSHTTVRTQGRAALVAHGRKRIEERARESWTYPLHWNNNLIVEGDDRVAFAICYMMRVVMAKSTGDYRVTHLGVYEDQLLKVDDRWLFKSRKLHLDSAPPPTVIPQPSTKEPSR